MAKNWKDDFNYDRSSDWLLSAGRTNRLVSHIGTSKEDEPDYKAPQIRQAGGGDKPVTAILATEPEPPLTREEAINQNGFSRGRR
jgi:hypothetical protein